MRSRCAVSVRSVVQFKDLKPGDVFSYADCGDDPSVWLFCYYDGVAPIALTHSANSDHQSGSAGLVGSSQRPDREVFLYDAELHLTRRA